MFTRALILAQEGSTRFGDSFPTGDHPIGVINQRLREHLDVLNHPESLLEILRQINLVWAVIFIILGMLCVLNGYRWHKGIVIVLAALSGVWAGSVLGNHVGDVTIAAACFAILFGLLAWPLLKYAVALFGGLAGAFAGANVWTAIGMDPGMHQMGAMIGLVVVGMLAFLAFRAVVIVLTTVGGASMLVLGALAAMMAVSTWDQHIEGGINNKPLIIPIIVASAAAFGAVVQAGGGIKGLNQLSDKADPKKSRKPEKAAA